MGYSEKIISLLKDVSDKKKSVEAAFKELKYLPFESVYEFAKIDHHRSLRSIFPEVVFCEGKTTKQAVEVIKRIAAKTKNLLATRASPEIYKKAKKYNPNLRYDKLSKVIYYKKKQNLVGQICIISAGTSDIPVADEAYITCLVTGSKSVKIYDVGVAGVHRLFEKKEIIENSNILIVVAGMEAALPSVVAGFSGKPVIAVPTSVGYGTAFKGITALLGILNSCATGIVTVNIDNGFGAGYFASMINRAIESK